MNWLVVGIVSGFLSLGVALRLFFWVKSQNAGSSKAKKVALLIKKGSASYLKKLYSALALVVLILGSIILFVFGPGMTITFVLGALCSTLAGYLGMTVAVEGNVRSATACQRSLKEGFKVAFNAGAVLGLAMVGLAVIGMSLILLITNSQELVLGFSVGASTLALLAKAGGGIYTKAADIAADLVGKVEAGIPEDDPRNPAVIADNVGDNVGDVAGMGADIFDSYVASSVAVMLLGATIGGSNGRLVIYPLILCTLGIFASLIGMQTVKVGKDGDPGLGLNRGTIVTCVLFSIMLMLLTWIGNFEVSLMFSAVTGLVTGVIIGLTTEYFTSDKFKPVQETARVSGSGAAITIITGFSYGLISIAPSVIGVAIATLISYQVCLASGINGVYGIGVAAVGMLAVSGMIVSADAYGPIVDNARGIAEMAGMGHEVIERADVLDSAGNTAKAITKGFSISAAALTVLALFAAFAEVVEAKGIPLDISLRDPLVITGVLLGAITPPIFSALTMLSVTKNAFAMIEEIRRQWLEKPGILKGKELPDYEKCVGLAAQGALSSLVLPALLAVVFPLLVGIFLGMNALGGFLGGSIFTGVIFALFMANSGGLWDNAKKYIETGRFGGSGSEAHKASVIGDTVGDPFKDTAGPSLNTLITVMSLVSSLFAPVIIAISLVR